MKFCHVTLMVKNLEDSIKFYEEIVGLSISRRFQSGPGVDIAFLTDGEGHAEVELIYNMNLKDIDLGKDVILGFEVESLDATLEFVTGKGYSTEGGIISPAPNVKFFFIRDPNEMKIQFVENIS